MVPRPPSTQLSMTPLSAGPEYIGLNLHSRDMQANGRTKLSRQKCKYCILLYFFTNVSTKLLYKWILLRFRKLLLSYENWVWKIPKDVCPFYSASGRLEWVDILGGLYGSRTYAKVSSIMLSRPKTIQLTFVYRRYRVNPTNTSLPIVYFKFPMPVPRTSITKSIFSFSLYSSESSCQKLVVSFAFPVLESRVFILSQARARLFFTVELSRRMVGRLGNQLGKNV